MNNKIKKPVLFLLCLSATLATLTACGKKTTKNTTIPTPTTTKTKETTKRPPSGNPRVFFIVDGEIYQEVEYLPSTAAIVEPAVPTKAGFNIAKWSDYSLNGYDQYVFALYFKSNTTYTVEYYLQNLENDEYTLKDEDTQSFTTTPDKVITPDINTYDGFKCINAETEYMLDEDSSKNVIKIYYDRLTYDINFDLDNGTSNLEYSLKYGATIPAIATPVKEGYEFTKFTTNGADIDLTQPVSQSLNIKANYAANTNTAYTVKYYQENLYDDGYTLVDADTENKNGTTDTDVSVTVDPNKYTGFTVNQDKTISSGKILGDGSLELAIYYKRNTYTVTYKYADGVTSDVVETLKYGAKATNKSVLREGYSFDGWVDLTTSNLFNFDNTISKDYILNASYSPSSGTAYKINVYFENANNDEYTLDYTYTYSATTGEEVSANINDYIETNFEFNAEMSNDSGIVQADGSLLLNLYFKRKVYTLTFLDRTTSDLIKVVEIKHGCIPSQMPEEFNRVGYNIQSFADQTLGGAQSTYSELLNFIYSYNGGWGYTHNVKITYKAKTDIVYKVRLYLENVEDDGYTFSEELTFTGTTGDAINPQSIEHFIFDHASGYTEEDGMIIKGDGTTVIKAYYNRERYTINFSSGIDGVEIESIENIKYEARVSEPELIRAGYSVDYWWGNQIGQFNFADYKVQCNETLYCYWVANINTKYKVKHYVQNIDDDDYTLYAERIKEGTTDSYIYYYNVYENIEGCSFSDHSAYSIQIKGDGSSEISIYYTRYTYNVYLRPDSRITLDVNGESGTYYTFRYGKKVRIKATFNNYLGYEFDGFYDRNDGDALLTNSNEYEFTITDRSMDIKIVTKVISELENFNFTSDENNLKITSVKEMPEVLVIPDIVTEIGSNFAHYNSTIKELQVGKNVKTIYSSAFYNCANIETITFKPDSKLEVIYDSAFEYSKITNITIPNSLKVIGNSAFRNTSLENVEIGPNSSLEEIGYLAFYDTNISEINLPSTLKKIGDNAFNTLKMDELVIPASVEEIDSYAFNYCEFNTLRFEANENRTKITECAFNGATIKKIIIPNTVKEIEDYAFGYTSVEELIFEEGSKLETIGIEAFYNSRLKYIVLPDNLKLIKQSAFYDDYCRTTYVIVNSKLLEIEDNAFYGIFPNIVLNYSEKTFTIGDTNYGQIAYDASYIFSGEELDHILIDAENGFAYNIYDDEKELIAYFGDERNVVIPSNVTKIKDKAFYNNDEIISVVIPDSVTSIGKRAFYSCDRLTSITLGSGLSEVLEYAFYNCSCLVEVINNSSLVLEKESYDYGYIARYALNIITDESSSSVEIDNDLFIKYTLDDEIYLIKYIGNGLDEIVIPSNYTYIYNYAFHGDYFLKKITLGNGVKVIGQNAFQSISNLEEFIFEENSSLEIIGQNAFAYNSNERFKSIVIPNTVKEIRGYAFYEARYLETITFEDDSILELIGSYAFYNTKIKEIILPDSLVTLDYNALYSCSELEKVTLGTNLETIGRYAFAYDYNLKEIINNSENLTTIDEYAFLNCHRLIEFTLNETLTTINTDAFANANIMSIYNKSGLTLVKGSQEYGQIALKALEIYSNEAEKNTYIEDDFVYYEDGDDLYLVTYLGEDEDITIKKEVTIISNSAFYGNETIKNVSFEADSKLRVIKEYAFCYTSLDNMELPNSLEVVEKEAGLYLSDDNNYNNDEDGYCYYLGNETNPYLYLVYSYDYDHVTINENCKIIGNNVFSWATIEELVVPNSVTYICEEAFNYTTIGSFTLSENIEVINKSTFYGTYMTNITIPKKVKRIDEKAFCGSQLVSVIFEDDSILEEICENAFDSCYYLESIVLPDTLKTIGNYAFAKCYPITEINIPKSVEYIGEHAFENCRNLATLTFDDESSLLEIGAYAFYNTVITEVVFPESLEYIGDYAFAGLETLTTIDFVTDSNLTEIGAYAFNGVGITELVLPKSLEIINREAFCDCDSLISISVEENSNLRSLNYKAFTSCDALTTIDLSNASELKDIDDQVFHNCRKASTIKLPEGLETIGESAFGYNLLNSDITTGKLYLPKSLKKVKANAFYCISNITDIYYAGTIEDWLNIEVFDYYSNPLYWASVNFYILNTETDEYELVTDIVIPNTVTEIRNYAFYGIKNIKTVLLPTSIERISSYAFKSLDTARLYYLGSVEEYNTISRSDYYEMYYYSETKPENYYYYWHYVDGKITEYRYEEALENLIDMVEEIRDLLNSAKSGSSSYVGTEPDYYITEESGVSYTITFNALLSIISSTNSDLYYYLANYGYLIDFSAVIDVETNEITYSFEDGSHINGYELIIDDEGNLIIYQQ